MLWFLLYRTNQRGLDAVDKGAVKRPHVRRKEVRLGVSAHRARHYDSKENPHIIGALIPAYSRIQAQLFAALQRRLQVLRLHPNSEPTPRICRPVLLYRPWHILLKRPTKRSGQNTYPIKNHTPNGLFCQCCRTISGDTWLWQQHAAQKSLKNELYHL